ncbi:aquaporin [Paenarthrobacter sp. NPDC089675]|uniref:aquaporin n=1 Tax=Paenarthrobacter sp. NPDC089675 TaxID=3364376 RepID=UPI003827B7E5
MKNDLAKRAAAESIGTCLLVMAVVGSGVMASRLSPNDVGLQLLQNSLATGAALVALILALQPVSASFNPVVTFAERALGMIDTRTAAVLASAQVLGGLAGTVAANLMFGLDAASVSTHERSGPGLWLGEVIATAGLLVIVFGTVRSGRADRVAFAVGGYITAAYWFTSSTNFANPAVTIARTITDTFAGIAPASAPGFILSQLAGGILGFALIRFLYPVPSASADAAADRKVLT